jgi:hypothetical protein
MPLSEATLWVADSYELAETTFFVKRTHLEHQGLALLAPLRFKAWMAAERPSLSDSFTIPEPYIRIQLYAVRKKEMIDPEATLEAQGIREGDVLVMIPPGADHELTIVNLVMADLIYGQGFPSQLPTDLHPTIVSITAKEWASLVDAEAEEQRWSDLIGAIRARPPGITIGDTIVNASGKAQVTGVGAFASVSGTLTAIQEGILNMTENSTDNSVTVNSGTVGNIQAGSGNAQTIAALNVAVTHGENAADILGKVMEYLESLRGKGIADDVLDEGADLAEAAKSEASKTEPDHGKLGRWLDRLKGWAEKVGEVAGPVLSAVGAVAKLIA